MFLFAASLFTFVTGLAACKSNPNTKAQGGFLYSSPLSFGSLPVGTPAGLQLNVQAGVQSVTVLAEYLDGGDLSDFRIVSPIAVPTGSNDGTDGGDVDGGSQPAGKFPETLNVGTGADGLVVFQPADAGARSSALVLIYDPLGGDGATPGVASAELDIPLTGTGIATDDITLQVTPTSLDFGSVQLGQYRTLTLKLHNTNTFPTVPTVSAFDGGEFSSEVPVPLQSDQTEDLQVTFVAQEIGSASATLSVQPCPSCTATAIPVQLTGEGIDAELKFNPEEVDFGFVLDGTQPPPITVTVTISGNVPVTLGTPTLTLANRRTSIFNVTTQSLPAGTTFAVQDAGPETFTFDVTYSPSDFPGGDVDQIFLHYALDGVAQPPLPLVVTGNRLSGGCQLVVLPSEGVSFGMVLPGQQATQTLKIINQGGAPCTLSDLTLDGGGTAFTFGSGSSGDAGVDGGVDAGSPAPTNLELAAHSVLGGGIPVTFTSPASSPFHTWQAVVSFNSSDPLNASVQVPLSAQVASPYAATSPWPKWGHDNSNTGQGEIDTSATTGTELWSFSLITSAAQLLPNCAAGPGSYYANSPMIANQTVWVLGCDGVFYGLDEKRGGLVWSEPLSPPSAGLGLFTTPLVAPDGVLMLSTDNFYQIDPNSRAISSFLVGGGGSSNPTLTLGGELIYALPQTIDFFAPQAAVGSSQPSQAPVGETSVSPAVQEQGGLVTSYWCSAGTCLALQNTGLQIWQTTVGPADYAGDFSAPVLGNGTLYTLAVGSFDGGLVDGGFDDAGDELFVQGDVPSLSVVALDVANGNSLWTTSLPAPAPGPYETLGERGIVASPALASLNNLLIVPGGDGVYALQTAGPNAGQIAWKLPVAGGVSGSPAIGADGTIFVGTNSAGLLAIDPVAHTLRWSFVPRDADGGPVSIQGEPAIGEDGIYFLADDGALHAVH